MWTMTSRSLKIIDASDLTYILEPEEECLTTTENITIIHMVNITQIRHIISSFDQFDMQIIRNAFGNELIQKLLHQKSLLLKIYNPRQKRWETLGKMWKWISGSPDAEDLKIINQTLNNMITEENNQIIINKEVAKRFKLVQKNINKMGEFKDDVSLYIKLTNALDMINHELEYIIEAISFAKNGIIYPEIFTNDEMLNIVQKSNLDVPQLIHHGSVKVLSNNQELLFIFQVPKTVMKIQLYRILPIKSIVREVRLMNENGTLYNQCNPQTIYKCFQKLKTPECIIENGNVPNIYEENYAIVRIPTNVTLNDGKRILVQPPKIIQIDEDIKIGEKDYIYAEDVIRYVNITSNNGTIYMEITNLTQKHRIEYVNLKTDNLHFSFKIFSFSSGTVMIIIVIILLVIRLKVSRTKKIVMIKLSKLQNEVHRKNECQEDSQTKEGGARSIIFQTRPQSRQGIFFIENK